MCVQLTSIPSSCMILFYYFFPFTLYIVSRWAYFIYEEKERKETKKDETIGFFMPFEDQVPNKFIYCHDSLTLCFDIFFFRNNNQKNHFVMSFIYEKTQILCFYRG